MDKMIFENKDVTPKEYDTYWNKTGVLIDDRVKEIAELCPDFRAGVDLGGGTGGLVTIKKMLVVDWSPVACQVARDNGFEVEEKNILDFLKTDRKFDLVVLGDVLEEMRADETNELLDGIARICTKYFVISTPTHENYLNLSTHQVIYNKDALKKMITDRGFTLEKELAYSDRLIARFSK